MYKLIIKRLLMMIPVLLGVTFIIFTLMYFTPGDPARALVGSSATIEEVEAVRVALGLNEPFIVQYITYVKNIILHFDLGTS